MRRLLGRIPLFLIVAALALGGCDQSPTSSANKINTVLRNVRDVQVLRVGWAPYAPYAQMDTTLHTPTGFYVDLVEEMAREAGWKVVWVETTWGTMVADLETQKFEMLGAPVYRTIPRAESVAFTRPIGFFGLSAIARKGDERFKTLEDFERPGLTIALTQGEVGDDYTKLHLPNAKRDTKQSGNISLALTDVIEKRADVAIADAWTIAQFAKQHEGQVVDLFAGRPFDKVGAGWMTRQGDPTFLGFLNTAIDWLESSGQLDKIRKRYPNLPETVAR